MYRMWARMEGVERASGLDMAFQLRIGRGDRLRYLRELSRKGRKLEGFFFWCVFVLIVTSQFSELGFRNSSHGVGSTKPGKCQIYVQYMLYNISHQPKRRYLKIGWRFFFGFGIPFFRTRLYRYGKEGEEMIEKRRKKKSVRRLFGRSITHILIVSIFRI